MKFATLPISPSIRLGLVVVTYNQPNELFSLTGGLLCQTFGRFTALAYHDGPDSGGSRASWGRAGDSRFQWAESPARENCYGHTNRQRGFEQLLQDPTITHIGTTNADNQYAPVYFEAMAEAFSHGADLAYCDMVHSHRKWAVINSRLERKFVDAGNWMASRRLIAGTKWDSVAFAADWDYVSRLRSSAKLIRKIPACLFIHN